MEKCKVTVILTQAAPGDPYVATFPAFPTWSTQGDTVEEALRMAEELVELNPVSYTHLTLPTILRV